MGAYKPSKAVVLAACLWFGARLPAQNTGQTIRHHKIAETDNTFPLELIEAESAIEKKDYTTARPLLEKLVATNGANYQAWFDLGFVYHSLGDTEGSIAAY